VHFCKTRHPEILPGQEADAAHIRLETPAKQSFQSARDANVSVADLVCTFSLQYFRGKETPIITEGDYFKINMAAFKVTGG